MIAERGSIKIKASLIKKIISVTELLQAVVSILLQRPDDARGRPSDYVKDDDKYEQVFGEDRFPLAVYLTCLQIMNRVEDFVDSLEGMERSEKLDVMFYVAALLVCKLTQEADPSPEKVFLIKASAIDDNVLMDCYKQCVENVQRTRRERYCRQRPRPR